MLLPGASAYIGADIVGGLAAIDYRACTKSTLFIDIGTNGEIVLIEGPDRLLGTSCAMGPALEGMNTHAAAELCGRMIPLSWRRQVLHHYNWRIGSGICGSGLVDLVAALVGAGVIVLSGR
jgi:uncharacterized 2Fe-2S/4Fe-4S cluster protein (DUF4445 family)